MPSFLLNLIFLYYSLLILSIVRPLYLLIIQRLQSDRDNNPSIRQAARMRDRTSQVAAASDLVLPRWMCGRTSQVDCSQQFSSAALDV
ncbi:hypothetical protein B0J14DRAFT_587248 [Halenospora varia]|nr:hypothetical protein B0J14DRAFT_587248 [Halenospora varia]